MKNSNLGQMPSVVSLKYYIDTYYSGNNKAFGDDQNPVIARSQVGAMLKLDKYFVEDGKLFIKKRDLSKTTE